MTLKSPVKSLMTLVRYNASKKEQLLEVGTFLKQAHTCSNTHFGTEISSALPHLHSHFFSLSY